MIKKYIVRILSLVSLVLCAGHTFSQTTEVNQGLYHNYAKIPFIDSFELNRLWFKDSAIIYELKADIKMEDNDSVTYRGYDVFRYRFFDIPSNTYYEYNNFTDTATIICKYLGEEKFTAGFFSTRSKPVSGSLIPQADTIIRGEKLKALKYVKKNPEWGNITEIIYYFACTGYRSNLFGLLEDFNAIAPGCTLRENVLISYDSGHVMRGSDRYEIVRPFLDQEEEKIFSRWKKNTEDKSIQMSSVADMLKLPISPIKFRNNPKYPMYN